MRDTMFHVECVGQSDNLVVQPLKRFDLLRLLDMRARHVQYPARRVKQHALVRA